MSIDYTCSARCNVEVQCEHCHETFDYEAFVLAVAGAKDEATKNFKRKLDDIQHRKNFTELKFHHCPRCYKLQSWMRSNVEENNWMSALGWAITGTIVIGIAISQSHIVPENIWNPLGIPFLLVTLIGFFFILKTLKNSLGAARSTRLAPSPSSGPLNVTVTLGPTLEEVTREVW